VTRGDKMDKVYCSKCPIVDVCWGEDNTTVNKESKSDDCVLAKLYNGELKVHVPVGYLSRD
jgi:hypothetical protein